MKRNVVLLTGGLGNQLFQINAALSMYNLSELEADSTLGRPRSAKNGLPDAAAFSYPDNLIFKKTYDTDWLSRKATGFCLRMSAVPRKFEKFRFVQFIPRIIASLIISLKWKRLIIMRLGQGIGYSKLVPGRFSHLIVGYFQSYEYFSQSPDSYRKMKKIHISHPGKDLNLLKEIARVENPAIVHIRMGDYRNEPQIGMLERDYYIRGIRTIKEANPNVNIWFFSDEIYEAQKYLGISPTEGRWISEVDFSPASTLEAMRLGTAYLISNSTFSWWGATLSYSENPLVIAPNPWFINLLEPKALIPEHWVRIPR